VDERDQVTWVVLELSYHGERTAEEGTLAKALRDFADLEHDHPVFVPYLTYTHQGKTTLLSVMEGYVFIAAGFDDMSRAALTRSPYINKILTRGTNPHAPCETVSQVSVDNLRQRMRDLVAVEIEEGMEVRIVDGVLSGIRGAVVGVAEGHATLLVQMRSIHALQYLPCFLLRPVSDEDE
jgi:transcription antitermination factor NusG